MPTAAPNEHSAHSAVLLIACPDRKGLVATITEFIYTNNGNIIHLDQHVDAQHKIFFMRIEWNLADFRIPADAISAVFGEIATRFNMDWSLQLSDFVPRMAVFVSSQLHCLYDLLSRYQSQEWRIEIPLIMSNHRAAEQIVHQFAIDFHYLPVTRDNKREQEASQLELLHAYQVDFIVLARYMQILSGDFAAHYPNRIISIHHSFLPAFAGAKPYHSAYDRGVKIIGATSHYVTAELDNGPIIEQDVVRVSHKDAVRDLIRKGKDLEKIVLARAIRNHIQHKILVYNNKTVIFE
jgi:formyltetrahydrofolate deformylase